MEFIKISGQVNDITIPEGECKKIIETATGKILWQKKQGPLTLNSAHWEIVNYPTNQIRATNFVDYDVPSKKIILFAHGVNKIDGINYHNYWSFLYDNTSKEFSDFYRYFCNKEEISSGEDDGDGVDDDLTEPHYLTYMGYPIATNSRIRPVDVDPISKTIIAYGGEYNICIKTNEDEHLRKFGNDMFRIGLRRICWAPEKELFLAFFGSRFQQEDDTNFDKLDTALIDTNGTVKNIVQTNNSLYSKPASYPIWLCYAGDKDIFLYPNRSGVKRENGIWLSSNGLNWERSYIPPENCFVHEVCYCQGVGVFLAACQEMKLGFHILKSIDGMNWEIIKTFENAKVYDKLTRATSSIANQLFRISWSPKKKIACLGFFDIQKKLLDRKSVV